MYASFYPSPSWLIHFHFSESSSNLLLALKWTMNHNFAHDVINYISHQYDHRGGLGIKHQESINPTWSGCQNFCSSRYGRPFSITYQLLPALRTVVIDVMLRQHSRRWCPLSITQQLLPELDVAHAVVIEVVLRRHSRCWRPLSITHYFFTSYLNWMRNRSLRSLFMRLVLEMLVSIINNSSTLTWTELQNVQRLCLCGQRCRCC